jgi:D-3-phosphoglycerate dehydrogenase
VQEVDAELVEIAGQPGHARARRRRRVLLLGHHDLEGVRARVRQAKGERLVEHDAEAVPVRRRADVAIVRLAHRIDEEVLAAAKRLSVLVSATTGLDHIDLQAAERQGIAVLSLKGETEFLSTISATAELSFSLLLSAVRRLPAAASSVLSGAWDRDAFFGHELSGKRIGILGLGRIGRKIARYASAFEMNVAAYDPYTTSWVDGVLRESSRESLFRRSDVLSIHVPLNEETRASIGREELFWLPKGAVLVNTARGEILHEEALVEALLERRLSAAALDVIHAEREPSQRSERLLRYAREHDNLILTPHIGGVTYESRENTEIFMAKKLSVFLRESSNAVSGDTWRAFRSRKRGGRSA